jgi:hypothetical protein
MPTLKSGPLNMHRQILHFPVPTKGLEVHPHCLGELRHRQVRGAIEGRPHFLWDDIKNIPNGRHGTGMHVSLPPGVVGFRDLHWSPLHTPKCPYATN